MTQNKDDATVLAGVILVTHADYGAALLRAAEFILGPVQDCSSIQVDVSLDVEGTVARLKEAASLLDRGRGVIILTDMFGGTPTNLSLSLMSNPEKIEVVTGVNLPMLLKVFDNRHRELPELAEMALDAGRKGIVSAGGILRGKSKTS
ncbi:PTS sugar transporter subunit IIA [Desulfovibrio sp. OttesenSCG-928-I05]|nr:PTS sugar transporter subunit IIA [Desulfovibrio sp. OttesenSCG-928-I05]